MRAYGRHLRAPVALPADVVAVLDALTDWREARAITSGAADAGDAERLLQTLHDLGLVQHHDDRCHPSAWDEWAPSAAFFHFSTRDVPYPAERSVAEEWLSARARVGPPPPPTKRIDGARVELPRTAITAGLDDTLTARRTWRRFDRRAVPLAALGAVLGRTFEVQRWARSAVETAIPLKTSPSAGARHPVEAYLLAWHVEDLEAGVYHYDAADGALVQIRAGLTGGEVGTLLGHQAYYAAAGAAVVLTACFDRVVWKYPYPRAYRAVLIDVGHVSQTFCLTATAVGLAPFCTMAFSDSGIEALLGIGGSDESALFVVGVGTRLPGEVQPSRLPT